MARIPKGKRQASLGLPPPREEERVWHLLTAAEAARLIRTYTKKKRRETVSILSNV